MYTADADPPAARHSDEDNGEERVCHGKVDAEEEEEEEKEEEEEDEVEDRVERPLRRASSSISTASKTRTFFSLPGKRTTDR
jgi:hypothetical protein